MIHILCYGDSNTFGVDAATNSRLAKDERWPGVLRSRLGEGYDVIEEGLPGRTTVWYDPVMDLISGADYLYPCMFSHQPLDMVVIMLGTNDLKHMFSVTPYDVAWSMERLVSVASRFTTEFSEKPPKVFLISPPKVVRPKDRFEQMFLGAEEKSAQFARYYREVALKFDTLFCDAAAIAEPSAMDGIHIDAQGHKALGECVADVIAEYYANF